MAHARARGERLRTEALLVRKVPFGDADAMVTFFTEARGILSATARSAQRSARRFPSLEPMHLLAITIEERSGQEVGLLVEAQILRPRFQLVGDLGKLEAAGQALRWVREGAPPHTPEPALWEEVNLLLDALDQPPSPALPEPRALLAGMGLRLLGAIGWGLDLSRCVRCGKPCDQGASAYVDAAEGGLVCRSCGGSRAILSAERRAHLCAAIEGEDDALTPGDVEVALGLVEATLAAHAR
ncbi:MAG: DNA repair protein RecO [Byssovorax sp.]